MSLNLTRKLGESLVIGDAVVKVIKLTRSAVTLSIDAPPSVAVVRSELFPKPGEPMRGYDNWKLASPPRYEGDDHEAGAPEAEPNGLPTPPVAAHFCPKCFGSEVGTRPLIADPDRREYHCLNTDCGHWWPLGSALDDDENDDPDATPIVEGDDPDEFLGRELGGES